MDPMLSLRMQTFYYAPQSLAGASAAAKTAAPSSSSSMQPKTEKNDGNPAVSGRFDSYECQTCKNRKYQDGSNDPGVSFKTPTHLSPQAAPAAIRAHEGEHVSHARSRAQQEDQEIVSQSVTYHTAICPECGTPYMSGGTTRTTFRSSADFYDNAEEKGRYLDTVA